MEERLADEETAIREYANDLIENREPISHRSLIQRMLEENGKYYDPAILDLVKQAELVDKKRQQGSGPGVEARQRKAAKDCERIKMLIDKHGADASHSLIEAAWREDYPKLKPPSIAKISRIRSEL